MSKSKKFKLGWPDDISVIEELDDDILLKLWKTAPRASTPHEVQCSAALADEIVDRNLEDRI